MVEAIGLLAGGLGIVAGYHKFETWVHEWHEGISLTTFWWSDHVLWLLRRSDRVHGDDRGERVHPRVILAVLIGVQRLRRRGAER